MILVYFYTKENQICCRFIELWRLFKSLCTETGVRNFITSNFDLLVGSVSTENTLLGVKQEINFVVGEHSLIYYVKLTVFAEGDVFSCCFSPDFWNHFPGIGWFVQYLEKNDKKYVSMCRKVSLMLSTF